MLLRACFRPAASVSQILPERTYARGLPFWICDGAALKDRFVELDNFDQFAEGDCAGRLGKILMWCTQ